MTDVVLRKKDDVVSAAIEAISSAMGRAIADAIHCGSGEVSCSVQVAQKNIRRITIITGGDILSPGQSVHSVLGKDCTKKY